MRIIRNVLAHRLTPPRVYSHLASAPAPHQIDWSDFGLVLDENTASLIRANVSELLEDILIKADQFTQNRLWICRFGLTVRTAAGIVLL
jgi:hypothetical protein